MRIDFADYKTGDPQYCSARYWAKVLQRLRVESGIAMPKAEEWFKENYGIVLLRQARTGAEGISGVELPEELISMLLLKVDPVTATWFFNDV
jgi:hypothetical protein